MRQAYSLSPVSFGCVFPLELWVAEAGDSFKVLLANGVLCPVKFQRASALTKLRLLFLLP